MSQNPSGESGQIPLSEEWFYRASKFRQDAEEFSKEGKKEEAFKIGIWSYYCDSLGYLFDNNLIKAHETIVTGIEGFKSKQIDIPLEFEIVRKFIEGYIALSKGDVVLSSHHFREGIGITEELRRLNPEAAEGLGMFIRTMTPMVIQAPWSQAIRNSDWTNAYRLASESENLLRQAANLIGDPDKAIFKRILGLRGYLATFYSEAIDSLDRWDIDRAEELLDKIKFRLNSAEVKEFLTRELNEVIKDVQGELKAIKTLTEALESLIRLRKDVNSNRSILRHKEETLKRLRFAKDAFAKVPPGLINWNVITQKLYDQAKNIYLSLLRRRAKATVTFAGLNFLIVLGVTIGVALALHFLKILTFNGWVAGGCIVIALVGAFGLRARELILSIAELVRGFSAKKE